MHELSPALQPLAAYRQWLIYRLVPGRQAGKLDKIPLNPNTLRACSAHDPAAWVSYAEAVAVAAAMGDDYGAAFVLTAADPFWLLDIDQCAIGGQWSPLAVKLCRRLAGAAVEISQSGTGLHVIGSGNPGPHGCKNAAHGLELYTEARFIAITDRATTGNAATDCSAALAGVVSEYFPPGVAQDQAAEWTDGPVEGARPPESDGGVLRLLHRGSGNVAAAAFGGRATGAELWAGDADALARAYPDNYGQGRAYDASSADAALAAHLVYLTGKDCERTLRLMWRSGLVRDKWEARPDYLQRTILNAKARCDVLIGAERQAQEPETVPVERSGLPFQASVETVQVLDLRGARLLRYNGAFLTYEPEGYYREIEEESIRREVRQYYGAWLSPNKVSRAVDELKAATILDSYGVEMPYWVDPAPGMPDASELIVCRNGILHPETGRLYEHTDSLLTYNALPFDYDPAAPTPTEWLRFLNDLWPDDAEAQRELQKLFGYVLTLDTSLHKIFAIVGPKRSGKGTIARVLRNLVGDRNAAAPTMTQLGKEFGLESLIGSQIAIIPDARMGSTTDKAVVGERLLSISGEDAMDVPRKYRGVWHGKLDTRIIVMSNELPSLPDASGALASRYVIFSLQRSFYGREDHTLGKRLEGELPGILRWALEGLEMLRADGYIRTPASGEALADELDRVGSPVKAFVADRCLWAEGASVLKSDLWASYRDWHMHEGIPGQPMSKEMFGRSIKAAFGGEIREARLRQDDGSRPWGWMGLRLIGGETSRAAEAFGR